jgi:hypothetical protein
MPSNWQAGDALMTSDTPMEYLRIWYLEPQSRVIIPGDWGSKKRGLCPYRRNPLVNLETQLLVKLTKRRDRILLPLKCGIPLQHGSRADQEDEKAAQAVKFIEWWTLLRLSVWRAARPCGLSARLR